MSAVRLRCTCSINWVIKQAVSWLITNSSESPHEYGAIRVSKFKHAIQTFNHNAMGRGFHVRKLSGTPWANYSRDRQSKEQIITQVAIGFAEHYLLPLLVRRPFLHFRYLQLHPAEREKERKRESALCVKVKSANALCFKAVAAHLLATCSWRTAIMQKNPEDVKIKTENLRSCSSFGSFRSTETNVSL